MSTKTERNRKYVAHDEKKFSLFFVQRYLMVALETWWPFLVEKLFLNLQKIKKTVTALRVSTNTPNKRESYLLVNFALFNSRHEKILF